MLSHNVRSKFRHMLERSKNMSNLWDSSISQLTVSVRALWSPCSLIRTCRLLKISQVFHRQSKVWLQILLLDRRSCCKIWSQFWLKNVKVWRKGLLATFRPRVPDSEEIWIGSHLWVNFLASVHIREETRESSSTMKTPILWLRAGEVLCSLLLKTLTWLKLCKRNRVRTIETKWYRLSKES